jgi:hypothetical protein
MEISQGSYLCSYLYLKQAKLSFVFLFFFYKIEKQSGGWNSSCPREMGVGELRTSGRAEVWGKGVAG